MNGLALLIPIALMLGLAGLGAFFWALRSGQFEDLDGAALRILIEEEDGAPGGSSGPDQDRGDLREHDLDGREQAQ